MKAILFWEKGIFEGTYKIYSEKKLVGKLKENPWTGSAIGELNGKKYSFKTKGFLNKETQIVDLEKNLVVGKITHDSLMSKAMIEYSGKVANWRFNSAWNTNWSAVDSNGVQINFQGSSSKGKIEFDFQDDLLALTGLFVSNFHWHNTAAVIITILIPILTTLITSL
jgi:hypothetical protein